MSLENRINRTLNNLKSFKSRLVSNARKAAYIGLISLALAGAVKSTETSNNPNINPNNNSSWTNPDNLQDELIPKPELGYVIQTESETDINLLNNILSSSGNVDIKQIGGNRESLSIIQSNNTNATENEKTIQALKNYSQVRYSAPLFSANGETIAVIPEIVAKVKQEADYSRLEELCNSMNLSIKKKMDFTKDEYLIEVLGNDANAVFESVNTLNNTKFIEWASPNIAFQLKLYNEQEPGQFLPNDDYFPWQWHLNNTGQSGGTPNADINAPEAWEFLGGGGDPNITIAVLDTGVDCNHEDLFDNIWVNKNIVPDINLDGKIDIHDLDLDKNRFIDPNELNQYGTDKGVIGWDFFDEDNSPYPLDTIFTRTTNAHGTAVAGLAAAKGNNNIGVTGVAYNCKIMPIRILSPDKYTTGANIATAFRWAAENGADVLNCSWGDEMGDMIIHSAIKDITFQEGISRKGKGCIILGSSGNNDSQIIYPARYPEVIAVGATDNSDKVWGYSGIGLKLEVVAPGGSYPIWSGNFLTTDISGLPGYNDESRDYTNNFAGTSSSCPIASGVAALVLSRNPNLTGQEARRILSRSAKDLGEIGWDEFYGNGRVDAYAAVKMALNPPEPYLFVDDDAVNDLEKGNPDMSDLLEDGSTEHPFDSIQEAINIAIPGDIIKVFSGVYTGKGNHDIDFHGKAITVSSMHGPESCIIDCEHLGRGFNFSNEEKKDSVLEGLTIINGYADFGAGIRFAGNYTGESGPTIKNCIFTNNFAQKYGGGIENKWQNPILINCTFNGNIAEYGGGVSSFYRYGSFRILKANNCIFWDNIPDEVYIFDGGNMPEITYSNIKGGWAGEGNINVDPLFADPENGDYHLKSQAGRWNPKSQTWVKDDVTSPCIDAGNPGSSLENELLSIPGRPNEEVYNSRINMGAYGGTSEASFAPYGLTLPADLNNDGKVNLEDFAIFSNYFKKTGNNLPADLNKDGKVDIADLTWLTGDWLKENIFYADK